MAIVGTFEIPEAHVKEVVTLWSLAQWTITQNVDRARAKYNLWSRIQELVPFDVSDKKYHLVLQGVRLFVTED